METFIQPKIRGYRQLSEPEALLMNRVKELGGQLLDLIDEIKDAHQDHRKVTYDMGDGNELSRIDLAEPQRWLAMGRTDIQVGVMKIVRSIAQPTD